MQPLFPTDSAPVAPLRIYDDFHPGEGARERPYIAMNMVTTVDGKTTMDRNRVREPIGSSIDRGLMRRVRAPMDAVIRGGQTVRADPFYPRVDEEGERERRRLGMPEQPLPVVVTASCELPLTSSFFTGPRRALVLTVEGAPPERVEAAREVAEVVFLGGERLDLAAAVRYLQKEWGIQRLLSEGGPRLNYEFFKDGLVDELFWTIAPKISGFREDLTMVSGPQWLDPTPRLQLVSAFAHEEEVFMRYRVLRHDEDGKG